MKERAVSKPVMAMVMILAFGAPARANEPDSTRIYQIEETLVTASPVISSMPFRAYQAWSLVTIDSKVFSPANTGDSMMRL